MNNISNSIEQLTASLQELAASRKSEGSNPIPLLPPSLPSTELTFSPEVEAFVRRNQEYAAQTTNVSVGSY